jgi:hypothetical protein
VLAGDAEKKAEQELRALTLEQLGADTVKWGPGAPLKDGERYAKHIPKSDAWTKSVIEETRGKTALYKPGEDVEMLERGVWQNGTPVTNGKNWKVYEFDRVIGASDGKAVRWIRVEYSAGTIHGHPITEQVYRNLIRAR